ncbi:MAG: VOC family protein [Nostoc sp.]
MDGQLPENCLICGEALMGVFPVKLQRFANPSLCNNSKEESMSTQIFVNLPVKNLNQSIEFFTQLGFEFNPQFTDETATCMIVSENIFVMLLTYEKFKTFTPKEICDATKSTEVLVCLSSDSREQVDEIVRKAVAAGGTTYNEPQDHGFMYGHGFADLDGHIWEIIYMEPSAIN